MKKLLLLAFVLFAYNGFAQDSTSSHPFNNSKEYYRHQGEMDARINYKKYKGAGTGVLVTSLISPLVGLVPAITCSATEPKFDNLGFTDAELMKNPDYSEGYIKKAKKIKQRKVWTNFSIGLGVNILASIILISTY